MIIYPSRSATTNLIPNGGFETNTTGWRQAGTNTIEVSTDQVFAGGNSLKATYGDTASELAQLSANITVPSAGAYMVSYHIYIPTAYDGTQLRMRAAGFVGVSGTQLHQPNMALRDQWIRGTFDLTIDAGDLVGLIGLIDTGAITTPGVFVYIDNVQFEAGTAATPFVNTDGGSATRAAGTTIHRVSGIIRPVAATA